MINFGWVSEPEALASHPLFLAIAASATLWVLLFRPMARMVVFGFAAYFMALVAEYYALPVGYGVELLFIAPVVEEAMKFLMNRSKTLKGGIAIGWGFSILENASYFIIYAASPILLLVIAVRSISDTMMHTFNAGLSSFTYSGKGRMRFGLPAAMIIHSLFNLGTIMFSALFYQTAFLAAVFLMMLAGMLGMIWTQKGNRRISVPDIS